MSNDFLKNLQAARAAKAAGTAPEAPAAPVAASKAAAPVKAAPAPSAQPSRGVVPPDAPPRTTPVKARPAPAPVVTEDEIDHAEPTGAAEVAAAPEAKKPVGRPKKAVAAPNGTNGTHAAGAVSGGFALYIDCMPVKDISDDGRGVTLFEDWVGQIHLDLAAYAESKSLGSWWMLPFAEQKMSMSAALNARVSGGSMPGTMVIMSSSPGAKDAMDVLVPHASRVVKALRG